MSLFVHMRTSCFDKVISLVPIEGFFPFQHPTANFAITIIVISRFFFLPSPTPEFLLSWSFTKKKKSFWLGEFFWVEGALSDSLILSVLFFSCWA